VTSSSAPLLDLLASARRREILRLTWRAECSAGEIHTAMPEVTFGAVSQHLARLREAGVVSMRSAGRHRFYRARPDVLGPVGRMLETMWDDALYRLTIQAELEEARRGPLPRRSRPSRRSC